MIDPGLEQEAERAYARVIWFVGLGGLVVSALLVAIAWLLITRPPAGDRPAARGDTRGDSRGNKRPALHAPR